MNVVALEMHRSWREANARLWGRAQRAVREIVDASEPVAESMPDGAPAEVDETENAAPTVLFISGDGKARLGFETEWQPPPLACPSWRQIAREVAEKHGVGLLEMVSHRRDRKLVRARHEAMWRLHHETSMSLPQIGRRFNRDHTTVLFGIRTHEGRMARGEA